MGYLQLLPSAEFIEFGKDGCVFNLLNQKRVSCDEIISEQFKELLNGKLYIETDYTDDFNKFIKELMDAGLLYLYDTKVFHETVFKKSKMEIRGLFEEPPKMKQIYIQGSNYCNYNCKCCMNNSENKIINYGCNSCMLWGDSKEIIDLEKSIEYVKRLIRLHHSCITISSGNVFLNWQRSRKIIKSIRQIDYKTKIIIIHNGTYISEKQLDELNDYKVELRIMLFGYDEKSYLEFTGSKKAFRDLCELKNQLDKRKLPYEFVAMGNYDTLEQIEKFSDFSDNVNSNVEIVCDQKKIKTTLSYEKRKQLPIDDYYENKRYNRCLYGKLALTYNGKVMPCPMWKEVIADLTEVSFEALFQNRMIDRYWRMTRENMKYCGKCPYQWLCSDCMILFQEVNKGNLDTDNVCGHMKSLRGDKYA